MERRRVSTPMGMRNRLILHSCRGNSLNQLNRSSPDSARNSRSTDRQLL